MKFINVYSLPRSSTNLFAGYLMMNSNIVSYNVGGGRYPFISKNKSPKNELFQGPGIRKLIDSDTCFVRDELKANFIGPWKTYPAQLAFKFYERFFHYNQKRIILLRNPFGIAASMQSKVDRTGTHKHVWDLGHRSSLEKFSREYVRLVGLIKTPYPGGTSVVDPWLFFSDENVRSQLFKDLDLPLLDYSEKLLCKNGHEYSIENNFYTCACGVLTGFGGFNPAVWVDPDRLLANKAYIGNDFMFELQDLLVEGLGTKVASCFSMDGKTNLSDLLMFMESQKR